MTRKKVTAKWLKEIRIAKGFKTQIEFAKKTGMHFRNISNYEKGSAPSVETLPKLKKALYLTADEEIDFNKWYAGRKRAVKVKKKNGNGKKKKVVKKSRNLNGKHKTSTVKNGIKIPAGKIGVKDAEKLGKIIEELGGSVTEAYAGDILKMLVESRKNS
jgi:transcriptional regulator with XRE-family HTH domain